MVRAPSSLAPRLEGIRLVMGRPGWILLGLFAALATGCGGAPNTRPVTTATVLNPNIDPLPDPGRFYTPGLADYAARLSLPANEGERRLRQTLQRSLTPPPALDCYAREYAARFAQDGRDPDPQTAQYLATHCGLWDRPRRPISVTGPSLDAIESHLAKLPSGALQGSVAVGAVAHPDGRFTATLIPMSPEVLLDPIARTGPVVVAGRAVRGDGRLELWGDGPDEPPQKLPLEVNATGRFQNTIEGADRFDRFELARRNGRFRKTVALIRRGLRSDTYPTYTRAPNGAPSPSDLPAIVNGFRQSAKVPPLTPVRRLVVPLDDWLRRLGKGSGSRTPPGILDDRGWPYSYMRFGLTEGTDVGQALSLLVNTPTGSRLLLSPDVDEIAYGTRVFSASDGLDLVVVTLHAFTAKTPEVARAELLTLLNAERKRAGFGPLRAAPAMTAVAQAVAEKVLSGELQWNQAVPQLMQTVRTQKLARGAFGAGAFPTVRLDRAPVSDETSAMAPAMQHIGIGVVGGPLPNGSQPRYLVVYIVAEKQPGKG